MIYYTSGAYRGDGSTCRDTRFPGSAPASWAKEPEQQRGGEGGGNTRDVRWQVGNAGFQINMVLFICEELHERIEANGV